MLFAAICLAVMYTWLNATPGDLNLMLVAMFPVLHVMLSFPKVGAVTYRDRPVARDSAARARPRVASKCV